MIHAAAPLPPDLSRCATHPVHAARWLTRLTFILCGLIVIFMAVHGDEHGRRPRFVWQSSEATVKAAMLQALDPTARRIAPVTPPASLFARLAAALVEQPPQALPARPAPRADQAKPAAYLSPFANGPPSRI